MQNHRVVNVGKDNSQDHSRMQAGSGAPAVRCHWLSPCLTPSQHEQTRPFPAAVTASQIPALNLGLNRAISRRLLVWKRWGGVFVCVQVCCFAAQLHHPRKTALARDTACTEHRACSQPLQNPTFTLPGDRAG